MNLYFIFIQLIGVVAWILLIASYHRENTNKILIFQIISTILYCLHYYLLGAYSGLFICIFEVIIDYGYYKTDKDNYIFLASIPIYIIGGVLSLTSIIDILPIISSLIDGYTLTKNKKIIVIGAIISYILWVIYDIGVMSYSCAITDGLVALSNISILLFEYNIINKNNNIIIKRGPHINNNKT